VDKKTLESYQKIKLEKEELKQKLINMRGERHHASVRGSNPEFPYQPMSFHMEGYYAGEDEKLRRRKEATKKRIHAKVIMLQQLEDEIEAFIDSIPDVTLRLIFRYRYLDGLTQEEIGKRLHIDRSRISRKIDGYLKNAHKTQN